MPVIIQKIKLIGSVVSEKNRQLNKQTNKQRLDETDFIGPCATKVEGPIIDKCNKDFKMSCM